MKIEEVTFLLNAISDTLKLGSKPVSSAKRIKEYSHLEAVALNGAQLAAQEFPGFEWDIWSAVAQSFREMNTKLASINEPLLQFVSYLDFLEIVAASRE